MITKEQIETLRAVTGRVHHTESFGAVDGPGVRFVFFLQGCPLRCLYCHNPDSRSSSGGEEWTAGRAADEVLRYRNFIKAGGVTFSGGEPLVQPEFVHAVTTLLSERGMHVAIDTAGCVDITNEKVKAAVDTAQLILLDIKAADDDTAVRLTGRDLAQGYDLLDYCEKTGKDVWVRHVLLEGYTLDDGKLNTLAKKLAGYSCIKTVELLPFHKLGEPKWADAGIPYLLSDTPAASKEQTARAKEIFRSYKLNVQ